MDVSKYITKQIRHITTSFIETSFQIDFNYVSDKNGMSAVIKMPYVFIHCFFNKSG